jgi:hypothetical protein
MMPLGRFAPGRGLVREIYVNDPANVPPALQTQLLLPL